MDQDNLVQKFLTKLKQDKTPQEMQKFLEDLAKFSATELYLLMMSVLTEKDLQQIEKIEDEKLAQEEAIYLFRLRTGITPNEFIIKLSDSFAKEYLQNLT